MEISEIKQQLSIYSVLKYYRLQPDRNNMLKCPFHEDDTASMRIYPDTHTFNCFGCGKNGDAIEICSLKEGSKHKGLLKAAELCEKHQEPSIKRKNTTNRRQHTTQDNIGILTRIFEVFKNGLNHPVAVKPKEYLKSRSLNYELLEIGYNSGQFHHRGRLSEKDLQNCVDIGLLLPYNGNIPKAKTDSYTVFAKDCIIFPIKDRSGNIVSLYGRRTTDETKNKHYYLKNRTGLYPMYPNQNATKLILTEAIIDAATLLQIPEITKENEILSCYGTNGLTEEHKQAIKELPKLEEIIFFFDGDQPAKQAIEKYKEELPELFPEVKLSKVETPDNEDVNSLSIAYDTEIFTHLLENRKNLFF